jgi:phosphatidate phosphatase APP1
MFKRIQKLFGTYKATEIHVMPYRSYGTSFHLYVKGRVLDNSPIEYLDKQSFFRTVANAFRQFDTYEIPDITVQLAISGTHFTVKTDAKGYFLFDVTVDADMRKSSDAEGWMYFDLRIIDEQQALVKDVFKGEFLIPEAEADFGVITDIDDTLLNTGVTSILKWKVIRNSLFVNAHRRIPLEGAPNLYKKLHLGIANKEKNPIFYLSNSPWNMYQYLQLFLDHNSFPKGPVLLRSFNSIFQKVAGDEKPHKQKEIINILNTYPDLNFILIGDSGEHDASIYTDIAVQFPNRILCIYLRSVTHSGRMRAVKSIVDNFRATPVLLVETSAEAEEHAQKQGFI